MFERLVRTADPDGGTSTGRIDLYKRGCFVLEAKQSRQKGGKKEAVRLPKEVRLPGKEVKVRWVGRGVLLEPVEQDASAIRAIFDKLARYQHIPFMEDGRQQPAMPPSDDIALD